MRRNVLTKLLKSQVLYKAKVFFFMFVTKCHLSDLQLGVNYSFFFWRLPLKCDFCEWHWAKPLNNVAAQREKPIRPALSKTLREQDRLMRMNGRLLTHKLVHSACIQFSSSVPPPPSLCLQFFILDFFFFGSVSMWVSCLANIFCLFPDLAFVNIRQRWQVILIYYNTFCPNWFCLKNASNILPINNNRNLCRSLMWLK